MLCSAFNLRVAPVPPFCIDILYALYRQLYKRVEVRYRVSEVDCVDLAHRATVPKHRRIRRETMMTTEHDSEHCSCGEQITTLDNNLSVNKFGWRSWDPVVNRAAHLWFVALALAPTVRRCERKPIHIYTFSTSICRTLRLQIA